MVEEPNFEYKYELAYQNSFAARLSFRIMSIAAGVFLVAVIRNFYKFLMERLDTKAFGLKKSSRIKAFVSRVHKQHKAPLMPDGERGIYTLRRHF